MDITLSICLHSPNRSNYSQQNRIKSLQRCLYMQNKKKCRDYVLGIYVQKIIKICPAVFSWA